MDAPRASRHLDTPAELVNAGIFHVAADGGDDGIAIDHGGHAIHGTGKPPGDVAQTLKGGRLLGHFAAGFFGEGKLEIFADDLINCELILAVHLLRNGRAERARIRAAREHLQGRAAQCEFNGGSGAHEI